tara:strand:+ start:235 stop:636 length:402 start_codon:yes stop_codon:yes gene_type:complete
MKNKSKKIMSEISAGELLDKISILEIKLKKIKNIESLKEINKEYNILKKVQDSNIILNEEIKVLYNQIKNVNENLWDIEDKLRVSEKDKKFDQSFIDLARNVYFNNDKRAKIKNQINNLLGSNIKEIKEYVDY